MKKIELSRKSIKSATNLPEGSDYYKWMQYDVWGNEEDGWEVNNVFPLDKKIVIHDDLTDMDILKVLCAEGILNRAYINDIDVEYYDDFIELYEKETAQPIGRLEKTDSIESSRKSIKSEMTSRQYQNAIDKAARMITEGERDVQKICKMTKLDESDVQAIIDEQDEFENEINSSHKITQSKERSIMNGAIKELEELFSTKAKGNTVYFNDVNYTPLPLPVQNAVKAIMEEYPDMKYRMGLYSVTVLEKGEAIKSSRRAIKSGMTFEQAVNEFTADGKPWGDYWSMQQDWMAFIDGLERDGYVDYEESKEWVNPCTPETFKEWIRSSRKVRRIQSRRTYRNEISSSGAFADRDESDNPECIIEIKKDGKWKPVGIDKNAESGWSTEVKFTVFESEDKARKSGMARRVQNEGYSEKDGTLRFSTK